MDQYAPPLTPGQLAQLGKELGRKLSLHHRIEGGLACTMDVLESDGSPRLIILRRYWPPEPGELVDPSVGEAAALRLAGERGIPAPELIWNDRSGMFPERAIAITYIDAFVDLDPARPLWWAAQLASVLVDIHHIRPARSDLILFPPVGTDPSQLPDEARVRAHPLGGRLWDRREELAGSQAQVEPTYVFHDF